MRGSLQSIRVLFRVDASIVLASGHVMRCLTLARALAFEGAECRFACRNLVGHMIDHIRASEFQVYVLPAPPVRLAAGVDARIGVSEVDDAAETIALLGDWEPDWVVCDHYSLARSWEMAVRPNCNRILAIDDYTDRPHACDILLNQNLGVSHEDFQWSRLFPACQILAGAKYALLRQEFFINRPAALKRRKCGTTNGSILVNMGGVDAGNATGQVLLDLSSIQMLSNWNITVIMGRHAPHLDSVRAQVASLPCKAEVVVDTSEMARYMLEADFAIGAAGSTSWERCTLALPSIVSDLAENQRPLAKALEQSRAAIWVSADEAGAFASAITRLMTDVELRAEMSMAAASVADGLGTTRVIAAMTSKAT